MSPILSVMSSKGKVIHRQQFQNAQQVIEVTVKAKPRVKLGVKTKTKARENPFIRDCLLKKELEKLAKELEEKRERVKKQNDPNHERPMPRLKINPPKTAVEVYRKKKVPKKMDKKSTSPPSSCNDRYSTDRSTKLKDAIRTVNTAKIYDVMAPNNSANPKDVMPRVKSAKTNDILPPDMSWGEFLRSLNSSQRSDSPSSTTRSNDNPHSLAKLLDRKKLDKRKSKNVKKKISEFPIKVDYFDVNSSTREEEYGVKSTSLSGPVTLNSKSTLKVDKGIQTSVSNGSFKNLPSSSAVTLPKTVKNSTSQTHSPFGESALKLLQQLRERLHSMGDDQGSEIVRSLETYLGSASDKPAGARKGDVGLSSASPFFPQVFPPSDQSPAVDAEKERLLRVVNEQRKKLEEQEKSIEELKSLSQKLIAYNEQLNEHLVEATNNNNNNRIGGRTPTDPDKRDGDSGIDLTSSDDLIKTVKTLTAERDALLRENKDQREVILHLEIKLSSLEAGRVPRRPLTDSRPVSRQSTIVAEDGGRPHRNTDDAEISVSPVGRHTPSPGSDSAFEERSSKGEGIRGDPQVPAGVSRVGIRGNLEVPAGVSRGRNRGDPEILAGVSRVGIRGNLEVPAGASQSGIRGDPEVPARYRIPRAGAPVISSLKLGHGEEPQVFYPTNQLSTSLLSTVSSEVPGPSLTLEGSGYPVGRTGVRTHLSETPVTDHPHRFLESTHVSSRQKLSAGREFDPGLSNVGSSSSPEEVSRYPLAGMIEDCSDSE